MASYGTGKNHGILEAHTVFRSLLTAVKPGQAQDFAFEFAAALAKQHRLVMDVCSVIDVDQLAPAEPVPMGGGAFKAQRDERILATARQEVTERLQRIEAAVQARGIECHTNVLEGVAPTAIARAVQRCDLLVCGHTRGGDASERSMMHAILKHCARPTIIVPQVGVSTSATVLIAFDGSAQATRALGSFASSGLATGRTVHVVAFDSGSGEAAAQAETAQEFLRRHEIASEVRIDALSKDVGRQIAEEAQRVSAGLIVMGAFGKGHVRDFFFGSATRSILNLLPVPVLLDH